MLREPREQCPKCPNGRIHSREPVEMEIPATFGSGDRKRTIRTGSRYTCDQGCEWTERFTPKS